MTNKISRRKFLQYGVGALAGLTLGTGGLHLFNDYQQRNQTLANKLLDEFPDEIPGAREVEKQKVIGADKTLVHVRQQHLTTRTEEGDEEWKRTEAVQNDIYEILSYLISEKDLKKVYREALIPEHMEIISLAADLEGRFREISASLQKSTGAFADFYQKRIASIEEELKDEDQIRIGAFLRFGEDPQGITNYRAELFEELSDFKTKSLDLKNESTPYVAEYEIVDGAADKLYLEGKIEILPVETMEANLLAGFVAEDVVNGEKVDARKHDFIVMQKRENIALEIIAKNSDALNVMIYGGAHYWGDNINSWNSQNPNQKYSLIEITPESYRVEE